MRIKSWSASSVNRILSNPMYTGHLVYGKTSVPIGGGKRKVQDKEKWIYSKDIIPELAVISKEQFEKVQKLKNSRKDKNYKLAEENKMEKQELINEKIQLEKANDVIISN